MLATLVLDRSYQPHRIIGWETAAAMVYSGTAEVLETNKRIQVREVSEASLDDFGDLSPHLIDWFLRGAEKNRDTIIVYAPAVVRLLRAVGRKRVVRFSRINVMTRDGFTCQYCNKALPMPQLNYDHVVPRSKGGKTDWFNVVTSCLKCNATKAARTPEEAGMRLLRKPVKPMSLPIVALRFDPSQIRSEWSSWWYWNVVLESP